MWDECGVRYLRQLHQPHTVGILLDDAPGHFDRQSSLARPSDAGQGHQPRILQPRGNVDELLLAPDEAGHAAGEVVVAFAARWVAARAPTAAHGRNGGLELLRRFRGEPEGQRQALGGVAVRVCGACFELLDAIDAQAGALGERFLRQASRDAVLP